MINNVVVSGRFSREHSIYDKDGKKCIKNGLAYPKKFKKSEVEFIDVIAWNSVADLIEKYTKKGTRVTVSGYLQAKFNKDGSARGHEIVIENIEFDSRSATANNESEGNYDYDETFNRHDTPTAPNNPVLPKGIDLKEEDIPF